VPVRWNVKQLMKVCLLMRGNYFLTPKEPKLPLFAKLWFAFVLILVLCIWGTLGYAVYSVVTNPAIIGQVAGEIVKGYNETGK
jgi:hypothetical protein